MAGTIARLEAVLSREARRPDLPRDLDDWLER